MSQLIAAVFENGVFKPLEHIPLKEHQRVEIKVISIEDWATRFNRIIEKIHLQSSKYASEEIEEDISRTLSEVRSKKDDR